MLFARNFLRGGFSAELRYRLGLGLSFDVLKQLGCKYAARGDARSYEKLIEKFDPHLKLPAGLQFEKFVGFNGKGESTLDSFRVLRSGENKIFEKIYLKGSVDWVKVSFFMDCHSGEVDSSKVLIPKIVSSVCGGGLVVSHAEYVDIRS